MMPDKILSYKQAGEVDLKLHVFHPKDHKNGDNRPAVVFFFGGGWMSENKTQFYPQSRYLASRGMLAVCAEYRVQNIHGVTPRESLQDARSAIRWMRKNAALLGFDPHRFVAGGGSAGAHLAAAAALAKGFDEPGEDLNVSCRPDALLLFNPVANNGPGGFGHDRVKDYWESFSPMHNINEKAPPAIYFLGTEDDLVPVSDGEEFQKRMREHGVRCELFLYEGQPHGFFNEARYKETLIETDRFLASLGFLDGDHQVE